LQVISGNQVEYRTCHNAASFKENFIESLLEQAEDTSNNSYAILYFKENESKDAINIQVELLENNHNQRECKKGIKR
jgi:phenylacetate-coenzyme A ligase PaaK-like adenylate-forming protein